MFIVLLCAILAVNPALATAPDCDEDLSTTCDVYVERTLDKGVLPGVEGYQTAGVVGMVPVGNADAKTYANIWIE